MKKRKFLIFTGIRSEYDLMTPVFRELRKNKNIKLKFIVTGAHLSEKYGLTINDIKKDKFSVLTRIYSLLDSDTPESRLKSIGIQIQSSVEHVINYNPTLIIVTGDREESLVGSTIGMYLNIPVAHFAGGDKSIGNIDDMVRHAVTKLSHYHFCFSKGAMERLIQTGEEKFRIFNIGNPALDRIRLENKIEISMLNKYFNFNLDSKFILCIQHSVSSQYKEAASQMRTTIKALLDFQIPVIFIFPNSDTGSNLIIKELVKHKNNKYFYIFKNIERSFFINMLRKVDCIVGNSSMGILEADFLKIPTVDIGIRQTGRERNKNVISVRHDLDSIKKAIKKCLFDKSFINICKKIKPIYGNGFSSKKAAKILSTCKLNTKTLIKDLSV